MNRSAEFLTRATLAASLTAVGVASAAPLNLTDRPLFLAAGVDPNFFVTFDNSGSMADSLMPDSLFYPGVLYNRAKSSAVNGIYYNPALRYQLPLNGAGEPMDLVAPTEFRAGESLRGSHADTALPPKNWRAVEAALRWAAGSAFRFSVRGPRPVAAEFREGPTPGDRVVHLLNFAAGPVRGPIRVDMADEGHDWTLELASHDSLPRRAPVLTRARGRVAFALPGLALYTACILRPAATGSRSTARKDG